jgi:phenylpyruvate tautomerase PptA (4-oxalocrotonate tautomerase family)
MPYIKVSATQKLSAEKRKELADGLGEAIALIPGKDGRGLIVDLEDGKTLFVGGVPQENFVFADVRYYSKFEYHIKKKFTQGVFEVFNKVLGTRPEQAFLTITEYSSWGGFGDFKDEYYDD